MDTLWVVIGETAAALVIGYKVFREYETIDNSLFEHMTDNDYTSFGLEQVLLSALLGALIVCIAAAEFLFDLGLNTLSLTYSVAILFGMLLSFNLYEAIVRMETPGRRLGKFLFLTVACLVGFLVGAMGSIAVLLVLVGYYLFRLAKVLRQWNSDGDSVGGGTLMQH